MNLKIGLTKEKPGWEIVLGQEGIPNKVVSKSEIKPDEISALIVNGLEYNGLKEIILDYVRAGGAVLVDSAASSDLLNIKPKKKRVRYLISDPDSIYSDIGLLDINQSLKLLPVKKAISLDNGLQIKLINVCKGSIIVLPFDINEAILDISVTRLKFYPPGSREFPSERVARISKGRIRRIVRISLEFLHHSRHLPFIKLWYYPDGAMNVFLFRVDTDFCRLSEVKELYQVCKKNSISGSWFIETKSAETWIHKFREMEDQEIGLHSYWHQVFKDYQTNYSNIRMGLDLLDRVDLKPDGFAAPFGEWNESLGRAVEKAGFIYSSEFCLNYDDLPFYPYIKTGFSKVLQIPIHPIGIGRLARSHFSESEMWKYFRYILDSKIRLNEPIILYYHPSSKHVMVLDRIFKYMSSDVILKMSFYEFAKWWEKRARLQINARIEANNILIDKWSEFPASVWLKVSSLQGSFITPLKSKIDIGKAGWEKEKTKLGPAHDASKLRRFHWRDLLYDLESIRAKYETLPKGKNIIKFGAR
ncbi:MAG: polysaccharide deacetylase family protein [Candidatus Cloacimonadia bacterium]